MKCPNCGHKLSDKEAARGLGSKGGKLGGKVRASRMTKEQRSEAARLAVRARWAKAGK